MREFFGSCGWARELLFVSMQVSRLVSVITSAFCLSILTNEHAGLGFDQCLATGVEY